MGGPNIAKIGPYVMEVEAGTYAWCACGHSTTQPFCSGAHRGTGYGPLVVEIPQKRRVAFCGCKHTKTPPFCDGTHGDIKINQT